jgi:hypothetical protein
MLRAGLKKEMSIPLSDGDIREHLNNPLILKYSELDEYGTLENVLPNIKSYCVILYENSPNSGHWVCISRPKEGIAEYYDSYGGYVDCPLTWTPKDIRDTLGEVIPTLSRMFDECPEEVVYNKIKYQKESGGVSNCGRWVVLRIKKMLDGMNLNQFYEFCKSECKRLNLDMDKMVTALIN